MPLLSLNDFAKQELGYQPGTRIPSAEAGKIRSAYQHYINKGVDAAAAASRPAMQPEIQDVPRPGGGTVPMYRQSAGSWQVLQDQNSWSPKQVTANDGTVYLYDPNTGNGFPVRDSETGKPIKAATKEVQDSVVAMQQAQLQQDIAKLKATGAPWYRTDASYQKDIAIKQAQLGAMMDPSSVLPGAEAQAPSPSAPTPTPAPSPTPAPEATPAQAPTPDAAYLSSPVPAADPAPSPSMDPSMTPDSIKAAYKAGQLTKEQAVGMLKPFGY
jgi:hypothetical protein